jgi:sugar/nucleoside kinase (ribokinase family)
MCELLALLPLNGRSWMSEEVGMTEPKRIVVFGDVIDDIIVTPSGMIRNDTDTPSNIQRRAGGSAANMASWFASIGGDVDFVGRVGVMDLERHSGVLREAGVRPRLAADHELSTGTIIILLDGDSRSMLTDRGANAAMGPDAVSDSLLDGASLVHFTGYSLFGQDDVAGFPRLIERAKERGVLVSVDAGSAGFLSDFGPPRFLSAIAGSTILFPNLDEGRALTGLVNPREIAKALATKFPIVVLTLGTGGILVAGPDEVVSVNVVPASMVDPTGAGDAFCAGFLSEWLESGDLRRSAEAGSRLAAKAVEGIGGRPIR